MFAHPVEHPLVCFFKCGKEFSILICRHLHIVHKWKFFILVVSVDFEFVLLKIDPQSVILGFEVCFGYHMDLVAQVFFGSWDIEEELDLHDVIEGKINTVFGKVDFEIFEANEHPERLASAKFGLEKRYVFGEAGCVELQVINTEECVQSLLIEIELSNV